MYKIQIIKDRVVKHEFESITACLAYFDEKYPSHKWTHAEISRHAKGNIPIAKGIYFKIIDKRTPETIRKIAMHARASWRRAKTTETKTHYIKLFIEQVSIMLENPEQYRQSICKLKGIVRRGSGMAYVYHQEEIRAFNLKLRTIQRIFKKRKNYKMIMVGKLDYLKYGKNITDTGNDMIMVLPSVRRIQKIKAGILKPPVNNKDFLGKIGV